MSGIPKLKAEEKELVRDALRDLRVAIGARTGDQLARQIVYDWLVVTADRLVPGGRSEAALAVDLALRDLQAEGTGETEVIVTPPPPPVKPVPMDGAVLYLPATCGWFNGVEKWADILTWVRQWGGWVGLNFETTGSTGNLGVQTADWHEAYAAHVLQMIAVAERCAAAGVPMQIVGVNSNDFGKGWSASWRDTPTNRAKFMALTNGLAKGLLPLKEWILVTPVSEDDSRMPAALQRDVPAAWQMVGWPAGRLCGVGIPETHTGELKGINGPAYVCTDNPPAIEKHFGKGVWTAHTPRVAECGAYAAHYLRRGAHVGLYHRADRLHLLEHFEAFEEIVKRAGIGVAVDDVPPPQLGQDEVDLALLRPPGSEAVWKGWPIVTNISTVDRVGDEKVRFGFGPRPGWETDGGPKGINGNWHLFGADGAGGSFEWTVTGDRARDVRDCPPLKGMPSGSVVYFVLTAICRHGKRTKSAGRSQVKRWVVP